VFDFKLAGPGVPEGGIGAASSLLLDESTGRPTCSNRGAREELKLIVVSVGGGETRHIHVVSKEAGDGWNLHERDCKHNENREAT
jgi:hypothetical protein